MRRRWVFLSVASVIAVLGVVLNLPRETSWFEGKATARKAGRPLPFWWKYGEQESSRIPGNILVNAVTFGGLIAIAWFFTRPRRNERLNDENGTDAW